MSRCIKKKSSHKITKHHPAAAFVSVKKLLLGSSYVQIIYLLNEHDITRFEHNPSYFDVVLNYQSIQKFKQIDYVNLIISIL